MRKTSTLRLALIFGVIVFAAAIAAFVFFDLGHRGSSMEGVQLVDDHPLYTARYDGDASCGRLVQPEMREGSFACTLFAAFGSGDRALAGRNFDWNDDPALLLYRYPPDGYASVSMVDVRYLGISADRTVAARQIEQQLSLASNIPYDGMNEYGLFIGMALVPDSAYPFDPARPTIGSLCAMRLMLDHARNIDEAVELIKKYNIEFTGGPQIHYLLAEAAGRSAVIEYKDNALSVIPNQQPWQVATNFYLTGSTNADQQACWRYSGASASLAASNGAITAEQGMGLLKQTAQSGAEYATQWSALYNLRTGEVQIAMSQHYTNTHSFKLDMQK